MRAFGMTRAQWYLLTHLYYYDGLTQQELADGMDLTKSAAAKLIRKLEQKKWVKREDDSRDGRVQRVYLIEDLKPMVKTLAELATAVLETPLSQLSREEMSQLTRLLRKVETLLDHAPQAGAQLVHARARMHKALKGSHLEPASPHQAGEGTRASRGSKRK